MSNNTLSVNVRAVKLLFFYANNSLNAFGWSFISSKSPRKLSQLQDLKIAPTIDLIFLHTMLCGDVEKAFFNAGRSALASGVTASKGISFTIPQSQNPRSFSQKPYRYFKT